MFNLKKIRFLEVFLIFIFSFLLFTNQSSARDYVDDWYVKDFSAEIKVNLDSSLDITEVIIADCGDLENKHGIFRTLPTKYKTEEGEYILPTTLRSITDENNEAYEYSKEREADTIIYKIGDEDVEVKGENTYIIKYKVENAVRTERNSYDELYWNILGNFWNMEIDNFRAKIIFPQEIKKENLDIDYYAGILGSKSKAGFNYIWLNDNELEFRSSNTIGTRTGLTLSATFPKDIVTPYQYSPRQRFFLAINTTILKYIIPLIFLLLALFIWFKFGRNPKVNKPLIAEYEPPENLSPIEIGSLLNKGWRNKASIPATIINLAVKGYLKIEKIEKKGIFSTADYKFISLDKEIKGLYRAEEKLFENIFSGIEPEVKLSLINNDNRLELAEVFHYASGDLKDRGLISKNSVFIRIRMIILAVIAFLVFIEVNVLVALSSLSFIVFGFLTMNRLTLKGVELRHKIKGFKLYMTTAEKYRSRFYEKEGMMEEYLPYAIQFGITKQWINSMKNIYGEEYFKNHNLSFIAGTMAISDFNALGSAISSISSDISSHVSSTSSGAGGSGSSGGGGGGGGGGGW
jgi:uncharacterized membrane protein